MDSAYYQKNFDEIKAKKGMDGLKKKLMWYDTIWGYGDGQHEEARELLKYIAELGQEGRDLLLSIFPKANFKNAIAKRLLEEGDTRVNEMIIPLSSQLFESYGIEYRVELLKLLILPKDPRVFEPIVKCLRKEMKEYASLLAPELIDAIAELGDPRAIDILIETANGRDVKLKFKAIESAVKFNDPRIIKMLTGFLNSNEIITAKIAFESLKNLGWHPSTDEEFINYYVHSGMWEEIVKYGNSSSGRLLSLAYSMDKEIKTGARDTLKKIGDKDAFNKLNERDKKDKKGRIVFALIFIPVMIALVYLLISWIGPLAPEEIKRYAWELALFIFLMTGGFAMFGGKKKKKSKIFDNPS